MKYRVVLTFGCVTFSNGEIYALNFSVANVVLKKAFDSLFLYSTIVPSVTARNPASIVSTSLVGVMTSFAMHCERASVNEIL